MGAMVYNSTDLANPWIAPRVLRGLLAQPVPHKDFHEAAPI